jgi:filamentous hemagglutinin
VDPAGARVVEVTKVPDANGVYKARVAVKDPVTGAEVPKKLESSFFPDSWSAERVEAEVSSAYANRVEIAPGHCKGKSTSGVSIEGYDGPQGIKTAFPKYME